MNLFHEITQLDQKCEDALAKFYTTKNRAFISTVALSPIVFYVIAVMLNAISFNYQFTYTLLFYFIMFFFILFVKQLIKRNRPIPIKGKFFDEIFRLMPDNYSFPSAHSFAIFQISPLIVHMASGGIAYLFFFYAAFIAFSRMFLKFHFLSDVITGSTLGLLSGIIFLGIFL